MKITALILFTSSIILGANSMALAQANESVLLTLDKPFYVAGDSVHFTSYLMNEKDEKLGGLSSIYYVKIYNESLDEIVDFSGRAIDGYGSGVIQLPNNLNSDTYLIVAYTNWMLQHNQRSFFKKPIKIFGNEVYKSDEQIKMNPSESIQIWPEGGGIVNDFANKIGYQLNIENSEPNQKIEGYLVDHTADTLLRFKPQSEQIGFFSFVPQASYTYRICFNIGGKWISQELGQYRDRRSTIKLMDSDKEKLLIYGLSNKEIVNQEYTLVVSHNDAPYLKGKQQFDGNSIAFTIPKKSLKNGLNLIQLYDQNMTLSASKSYIYLEKQSAVLIDLQDSTFKNHSHIKIPLEVFISDSSEYITSISIRSKELYLQGELNSKPSYQEFTRLLTNSDLMLLSELLNQEKDLIQSFLLAMDNDESFTKPTEKGALQKINPPEQHIDFKDINGKLIWLDEAPIAGNCYIICSVSNATEASLYSTDIDENGNFNFIIDRPKEDAKIIVKPIFKDKQVPFELSVHHIEPIIKEVDFKLTFNAETEQVNQLIIKTNENNVINRNYNLLLKGKNTSQSNLSTFFDSYDTELDLKEYIELNSFAEVCKELIPGIKISEINGEARINLKKMEASGFQSQPMKEQPFMIIDGVPISNSQIITELPVLSIDYIRLVNREVYINDLLFHGVLEISTREGDYLSDNLNSDSLYFENYQVAVFNQKTFNFSNEVTENKRIPSFNPLTYWNPKFILSNKTKYIELNSGDDIGDFLIEINGVNKKGNTFSFLGEIQITQKSTQ
ncbi:hypothetical protein QYS49_38380 [Marivirga salinae]|uniref:TonB-dependent receptor plug domain-containing protein n=1 Tax=Marivirga salinarum TaxID=3059078 RepID=A0AA51RC98_9BACT|nr:hypothetical protein [Marivirga sp. BDSF4-3]WMN11448.1 hypothetical protein QYS49_38380 [Marivirga sp. BDSF4-3]